MIIGELTVKEFSKRRGRGKVIEYSNMIIVNSGPEGGGGCYLSEKEGQVGMTAQFQSHNENQLSVYISDKKMQKIRFSFHFFSKNTSNKYVRTGKFIHNGKPASYWSCSFRKDKYSRLQALGRKLRGIIEEIRFLVSAAV